jgi:hypothetical protein
MVQTDLCKGGQSVSVRMLRRLFQLIFQILGLMLLLMKKIMLISELRKILCLLERVSRTS